MSEKGDPFKKGFEISGYRFERKIGKGGYGIIFVVRKIATNELCAMKIEKLPTKNRGLGPEIRFMRELSGSPYFPHIIESGEDTEFRWYSMELLGPSLALAKYESRKCRFRKWTGLFVAKEMLRGIEDLHRRGYVHRDIKPGNFLLRPNAECPVCLVDFGLVKPYFKADGEHIPLETGVGFIGTCRYASLHAHGGISLSRRDDLISWFYSLVEMAVGKLPWPGGKDKAMTYEVKRSITPQKLCKSLPQEFQEIYSIVVHLEFNSDPDYEGLSKLLKDVYDRVTEGKEPRFDWELVDPGELEAISPIPMTMKAGPLEDLVFPPPKEKKHGSIGSLPGKKKESCIVA